MDVRDAVSARKSTRAFEQRPVSTKFIQRLLNVARHAPSGANTQPWQVAVVTGETKQKLQQRMEAAFRDELERKMDYQYYPAEWVEPYKSRRKASGLLLYQTLGIGREDKSRQADQWAANYRAFDAPVMLFFFLDPVLNTGSFLDYGTFLQSFMLAAVEEGLATCPQAALGEYPAIVKEVLDYPPDSILVCGMALGYEDRSATVNSYRTEREPVESFTRFFD